MGLGQVFSNAVDIAFDVFKDLVKDGKYVAIPNESGWGDDDLPIETPMPVIVNGLTQDDKINTSFYTQIQPTDTIIMVKGLDIISNSIDVSNSDEFCILYGDTWKYFSIIDHETDPAEALFLILLRKKKKTSAVV